jgi:hypothetical protein
MHAGMRCSSMTIMMSLQMLESSDSILCLYSLIRSTFRSFPLASSFCSIDDRILHDALRAPTTFLYPTDSRFRSSTVSSTPSFATFFIASTISAKTQRIKAKTQTRTPVPLPRRCRKKYTNVRAVSQQPNRLFGQRNFFFFFKKKRQTVVALGLLSKLSDVDEVLSFFSERHRLSLCVCMTENMSSGKWMVWLGAPVGGAEGRIWESIV